MNLFRIEKDFLNIICFICVAYIARDSWLDLMLTPSEKLALYFEQIDYTPRIMIVEVTSFIGSIVTAIIADILIRTVFRSKIK